MSFGYVVTVEFIAPARLSRAPSLSTAHNISNVALVPDPKKDPNYASLASEGFILDRSRVVVPTQFHGVALREGWLVEASVEDPLPPSFIYNDQPIPGGVDPLQEDDAKVSLHACLRVDEAFQMDILNGMQSRSEQKQWKERSGKSALNLIPLLIAQRDAAFSWLGSSPLCTCSLRTTNVSVRANREG